MSHEALEAQPVHESQIPAQIDHLKNQISEAVDIQENIRTRLEPVMTSGPTPSDLVEAEKNAVPLTPLADDLHAMACRISVMNTEYRDILNRLEL